MRWRKWEMMGQALRNLGIEALSWKDGQLWRRHRAKLGIKVGSPSLLNAFYYCFYWIPTYYVSGKN